MNSMRSAFIPFIFRKKFAGSWSDEPEMINWYNHLRLVILFDNDANDSYDCYDPMIIKKIMIMIVDWFTSPAISFVLVC